MNPLLGTLHPYPFERWRALTQGLVPSPAHRPISLGIGEPRHATPALVTDAITQHLAGLATYPAKSPRAELDFVLVSGRIRVTDFSVPDIRLSDHRPLICDFTVEGEPAS